MDRVRAPCRCGPWSHWLRAGAALATLLPAIASAETPETACERQGPLRFESDVRVVSAQGEQHQKLVQSGLLVSRDLSREGRRITGYQWLDVQMRDGADSALPVGGLGQPFAVETDADGQIVRSWHLGDDPGDVRRLREGIVRALRVVPRALQQPVEQLEQTDLGTARVRYEPFQGGIRRIVVEYARPNAGLDIDLRMDETLLSLDRCGLIGARGVVDLTVTDRELDVVQVITQKREYGPVVPVSPDVRQRALLFRLPANPDDWSDWYEANAPRRAPVDIEAVRNDLLKLATGKHDVATVRSWLMQHQGALEQALPVLLRELDLDERFRARLIAELGELDTREALRTLENILEDTRQQVGDRARAAVAMGFRADAGQRQFAALWSLWMPADADGKLPEQATRRWQLRKTSGMSVATAALLATGTLVRTLDPVNAAAAAQINAQLRAALLATTDVAERKYIVMALGNTGRGENADLLWRLVQPDQPEPLVREAVDALVRIGTKSDIERLIGMAEQLADGGVQLIADRLLASDVVLGEVATKKLAKRAARSRSQSLRLAVARALDRQRLRGNAAAVPALGQMRSTAASRDELRLILNAQKDAASSR